MNRRGKIASAKAAKRQQNIDAQLVSELFPGIAEIIISMVYSKTGVLEPLSRKVNFRSGSQAIFKVRCLCSECIEGYFDFTGIINTIVKARKTASNGKISCDTCIAPECSNVAYDVSIIYAQAK
jgi:predicted DNA-binding antitoxin AbrB/MazE fold protein